MEGGKGPSCGPGSPQGGPQDTTLAVSGRYDKLTQWHPAHGNFSAGCHFELMLAKVPCYPWKTNFIHSFHCNNQTELERTLDVIHANSLILQRRTQRHEAVKEGTRQARDPLCQGSHPIYVGAPSCSHGGAPSGSTNDSVFQCIRTGPEQN